jgi:hypothetical protein
MKLFRIALLAGLGAVALLAADLNGKWTADMQGPNGNTMHTTFILKSDGNSLTGSVAGARGGDQPISDGHADADTISFSVVREFNGNQVKINYKGKVDGDTIHFTAAREGGEGRAREFDAKRSNP